MPLAKFTLIGLGLRALIISDLFRLSCLSCVPFGLFCPFSPAFPAFPAFPVVLQDVDLGSGKDTLRRSSLSWKMPRSDHACTRRSPCAYFQFQFNFQRKYKNRQLLIYTQTAMLRFSKCITQENTHPGQYPTGSFNLASLYPE